MDMLLRHTVVLWISLGFLSSLEIFEECSSNNFPVTCEFVFRNVCFEFVDESQTWSQASSSCVKQGGQLLKKITSPIKNFVENLTSKRNISMFTWWLGEGVLENYHQPGTSE